MLREVRVALFEIAALEQVVDHALQTHRASVIGRIDARHPVGVQSLPVGVLQHIRGHLGHAAELARQRPVGAGAVAEDAAEHLHVLRLDAGRLGGAGALLDLGLAIDGEQPDAEPQRARDAALLLDGVAEGDAIGGGAGRQRHLDLRHGGGIEAGAHVGEQAQDLGRGVRLDRVEHAGVRQRAGEGGVVLAHDVKVEHHHGALVAAEVTANAQEIADTVGHGRLPAQFRRRPSQGALSKVTAQGRPSASGGDASRTARAVETRGRTRARVAPGSCRGLDGETPTARRAKRNKPLRCRPLEGRRDQKSPFVVALSCVPRGERGSPVSPPAAGCCRGPVSPPGLPAVGIHPCDHRS